MGRRGTVDGSGPFILDTFRPETEVVVTRWDDYPGTVIPFLENKGPAYVDAIRWVVILEESNRSNEVETGSVDGVRLPAPQDIDRLQANEDLVVIEFTDLGNFFLALNWTKEDLGFADPRVHQAISHAIDRQALVDTLYFGHAVPTPGPLYPSYSGINPRWRPLTPLIPSDQTHSSKKLALGRCHLRSGRSRFRFKCGCSRRCRACWRTSALT